MDFTLIYVTAFVMIVSGVGFIFLILRGNTPRRPQDAVEWVGVGLSGLVVVAAVALLGLATFYVPPPPPSPDDGLPRLTEAERNAPAPDFAFNLVAGQGQEQLAAYAGNVVLINFWATWCAPCLAELPDLNRLQDDYRDEGLVVLTLSDEHPETLQRFELQQVPLRTVSGYVDPEALPDPFKRTLAVRPATYLIDRAGNIREFWVGARDYEALARLIAPYLAASLAINQ